MAEALVTILKSLKLHDLAQAAGISIALVAADGTIDILDSDSR